MLYGVVRLSFLGALAAVAFLSACGPAPDELCAEAAAHLDQCLGTGAPHPDTELACSPAEAERILQSSCDELDSLAGAKSDGPWWCRLFPSSPGCQPAVPSCESQGYASAEAFVDCWTGRDRYNFTCHDTSFFVSYLATGSPAGLSDTNSVVDDLDEVEFDQYLDGTIEKHPAEILRDAPGSDLQIGPSASGRGDIVAFYWLPGADYPQVKRQRVLIHTAVMLTPGTGELFEKIGFNKSYARTSLAAVLQRFDELAIQLEYWTH